MWQPISSKTKFPVASYKMTPTVVKRRKQGSQTRNYLMQEEMRAKQKMQLPRMK
jgi:hypothetical protein